jgi:hypothetical protein
MLSNPKSITPITSAIMRDATNTNTALLCNELNSGQVTLWRSSSTEPLINSVSFTILFTVSARVERLELPANGFGDRYSTN